MIVRFEAEKLLQEIDDFDRELRDCLMAVAEYRARVRFLIDGKPSDENPVDVLEEVRAFLARHE